MIDENGAPNPVTAYQPVAEVTFASARVGGNGNEQDGELVGGGGDQNDRHGLLGPGGTDGAPIFGA
jgi:hypothetical protein